ncbi:MAG: hypothetical protein J0I07_18700, partial [Myxococcales bacterium]|nr:hypothetical protein [Myxococcales bacterium]
MMPPIRPNAPPAPWLAIVAMGATIPTALLLACATDGASAPNEAPPESETVQVADSGVEGGDGDASLGPCDDCEYFPERCEPDTLCPNGPFDPATAGGAIDPRTRVNVIRGRSANDVWVAGGVGSITHFDGTSWARSDSGTQESIHALWLLGSEEVAFGRLDFLHTRGIDVPDAGVSTGGWTLQNPTTIPTDYKRTATSLEAAWGAPGAEWLWAAVRPLGLWRLRRSPSDGFKIAVAIDPSAFTYPMTDIHGSSADVLWAVGDNGRAVRITGAQGDKPAYEMFNTQTSNGLRGVWTASESEAWAVGGSGTIRHYTGDSVFWDVVADVPTTRHLNAGWGTAPSDVWAFGDDAVVLHYDGT